MILVCGDEMLDCYWQGEVTRVSPEAPVLIFSVKKKEVRIGAAANVLMNVRSLGVNETKYYPGKQEETIEKIRLIAKGQQTMRVDFDYPQKPVENVNFQSVRVAIFIDYGKGTLANIQSLIQEAKEAGCTVLVDPKGYDYSKYQGADLVKPNLDEMRVMVGGWKDEDDLTLKAQRIRREADIKAILLTRASEGMSLYTDQGCWHIPAVAKHVVDVTGAGETAIAALGVGLHEGMTLLNACFFANRAAGIAVGHLGPYAVTKEEIEDSPLPRDV